MKFSKILVPIEGAPLDDEAIQYACVIARKDKAKVLVIYVIEVQRALPLDAEAAPLIQRAELALEHAENVAEEMGYQVESELLQARAAGPALVDEAIERGVDLIIMGVPYRKRLGDFSLGDTPSYVVKNAPCRVWLCRQAIGEEKEASPLVKKK